MTDKKVYAAISGVASALAEKGISKERKQGSQVNYAFRGIDDIYNALAPELVKNKLLTYDISEVTITVPVEKFTEGTVEIPINPVNVSRGFTLKTFPEKVKVRYVTSLSVFNKVSPAMFDAIVDATNLENTHPDKISIQLITRPSFVRTATADPERVDYILRKQ